MHTILSAQPQKVALTSVLPLCAEAKVQASLHSLSAQLLFAKLPYSKIAAAHQSFKKKNYYYHRRPTIQKIIMLTYMPTTSKNKNKNTVLP
jgi:hypothetical protein